MCKHVDLSGQECNKEILRNLIHAFKFRSADRSKIRAPHTRVSWNPVLESDELSNEGKPSEITGFAVLQLLPKKWSVKYEKEYIFLPKSRSQSDLQRILFNTMNSS